MESSAYLGSGWEGRSMKFQSYSDFVIRSEDVTANCRRLGALND